MSLHQTIFDLLFNFTICVTLCFCCILNVSFRYLCRYLGIFGIPWTTSHYTCSDFTGTVLPSCRLCPCEIVRMFNLESVTCLWNAVTIFSPVTNSENISTRETHMYHPLSCVILWRPLTAYFGILQNWCHEDHLLKVWEI